MTLQESLDAIRKRSAKIPAEVEDVILSATRNLEVSGAAQRALQVGDRAPSFILPDQDDTLVDSSALLSLGRLLIVFFRGSWCPYCCIELSALQQVWLQIQTNTNLVAISPQAPKFSNALAVKHGLSFPLLSDSGNRVARRFEVTWDVPHALQKVYLALGTDVPRYNGDTTWELPMASRFAVGQDGVIQYGSVSADYTRRPELQQFVGL